MPNGGEACAAQSMNTRSWRSFVEPDARRVDHVGHKALTKSVLAPSPIRPYLAWHPHL